MEVIEPGHIYELQFLDDERKPRQESVSEAVIEDAKRRLIFVNREPGHEHPGTQTQEVLRALIDRTYHCDYCMPHELNALIIHHLRMALVFHEARALERKAEKGLYAPEDIAVGPDGHFLLSPSSAAIGTHRDPNRAPRREFQLKIPQKECRRREY